MPKQLQLDFKAIQSVLRDRTVVRSNEMLPAAEDFFGSKVHQYQRVDEHTFVHVLNFETLQSYRLLLERADFVCFQITLAGSYSRSVGEHVEVVNSATTHITNFPRSESLTQGGQKLRGILIAIQRQYLLDQFDLNLEGIPPDYRSIFSSPLGMPHALKIPTLAATCVSAEQIISCKFREPLRSIYVNAKSVEIICDLVSQLNGLLPPQHTLRIPGSQRRSQIIEAAASIYRREIQNPPTIERLAFRLGLNRNELTNGFREMYGVTPHAYSRSIRMERAQDLLKKREMSVSEIARRVGYEGYASFSRAFQEHFGQPPSSMRPS